MEVPVAFFSFHTEFMTNSTKLEVSFLWGKK